MLPAALALLAALVSAVGTVMRDQGTSPTGQVGRVWFFGAAIAFAAFGLQVAALAYGAVLLVQPLIVLAVLFGLLVQSLWTRVWPTRRQWLQGSAVAVGVIIFVIFAQPVPARHGRQAWVLDVVVGGVLVVLLIAVLWARRLSGDRAGLLYGVASGSLFGLVAVQVRSVFEQLHDPVRALAGPSVYICAATIIAAIWCQQRAFATGSLEAAYPAMIVSEPVVAMVVSLALLGEKLSSHSISTAISIVGLAVMIIGVIGLARNTADEMARPPLPRPSHDSPPVPEQSDWA